MPTPMVKGERAEVVVLRNKVPDALIKIKEFRGDTFICVKRENIKEVLTILRDDPALEYKYFSECTCADYSTWTHDRDLSERFEVIYNLYSHKYFSRIFVKVGVDDGESVPSVTPVFSGAEYPEREVWDLFGVHFSDHPLLKRFLLPDDWVGHPLRKEVGLGGEDVDFDKNTRGPAVEDMSKPHAGESFEGKTGSEDVSGR